MSNLPSSIENLLQQILEQNKTNDTVNAQPAQGKPQKEPTEKIIHRIAIENRNLFYDRNRTAYIEVQDEKQLQKGNKYLIKVASEEFNEFITHECYTNYYKTPTNQHLKGLKRVATREAFLNGEKIELFNRVAYVDDTVYIDLGTPDRKVVKVDAGGIKVKNYPVHFQRHPHMEELPEPVLGGDLKELLYYFPPLSEHDQCLVLSWLVASFVEHIQRPFLLIEGAPGTGKTTLGLLLKSFIDPMEGAALSFNENENEVAQIIDHQFLPFFDNLTSISRKLSNLMCRAYSGGSHLKKELYTDDKDFILKLYGNMIFTAIRLIKPQSDFLQRCYKVVIDKTGESNRSREQFAKEFEIAKPRIFGALLETLSKTLAAVSKTPFNKSYRTGDFDRYAATAADVLGDGADFFWEAREECEQLKKEDIAQNTPLINGITKILNQNNGVFKGYMTKLLNLLKSDEEVAADVPNYANVLSRRINEIMPELNAAGIIAETQKSNDGRGKPWTFRFSTDQQNDVGQNPNMNSIEIPSKSCLATDEFQEDHVGETEGDHADQYLLPINPFLCDDDELNSLHNSGKIDTSPVSDVDFDEILKGSS